MLVILDTNIFINALLNGSCRPILEAFIQKRFKIAITKDLIDEILEVCDRPKFLDRIGKEDRERLLAIIKETAAIVNPKIKINDCRDVDDNVLLECALTSKANMIVSNDEDLLVLHPYRNVSIVTSEEFLRILW